MGAGGPESTKCTTSSSTFIVITKCHPDGMKKLIDEEANENSLAKKQN